MAREVKFNTVKKNIFCESSDVAPAYLNLLETL
jgi:hypothetical protein